MKARLFLLLLFMIPGILSGQPWDEHGKLKVDPEIPHYIIHEDGKPFFWFGDTGWELFHRLTREEADFYLENRKNIGFNVIQAVLLSEMHGQTPVNIYGDSLFFSNNPSEPLLTKGSDPSDPGEYDYWDHAEFIIRTASSKSLYVALLPTWGEWVIPRGGKALFNNPEEAYKYGWFVADRFKEFENIIWVLGGDRHPDERENGIELWRAMAEGITDAVNGEKKQDKKADYRSTFMTHHGYASSSRWFHNDPWIDFHMWGSYHGDFYVPRSWQMAIADWNLPDPRPTINGEPNYEDHNVNYGILNNAFFTSVDVRIAAYWSIFSGCAGFTYGAHQIWQFTDERRAPFNRFTAGTWQKALSLPGAAQLMHLKKLLKNVEFKTLTPDQGMIVGGQGTAQDYCVALRDELQSFIYIPAGGRITVKNGVLKAKRIEALWFDPRTGEYTRIENFENKGEKEFITPPVSEELSWLRTGRGCDWVLVLKASNSQK